MQSIQSYFNFVNSSLRSNCYRDRELVINVDGAVSGNIVSLAAWRACFMILQLLQFLKKYLSRSPISLKQ